ncbi:type I polyketide synthase [Amycolatopsis sp. H20-H5]|uniref:type I polyketide synthase n=1 Tax=Amycolatopsis sp. H20-H5 TaxID=3046309 RepID=UPI002DB67280|nr:polyketide synthase [Amycolatopsis sp. H20-H5]MEC3982036.1 beta-ketoacyl synthase N-terminal-like domain-containing protein [Amycolatopsis sp. H20-H5]
MTEQNVNSEEYEPIAVVGMSCRLAGGVASPEDFWRLLIEGRDAISEVPEERWASYLDASSENAAALRKTTRFGGFLDNIDGFDAEFFGVMPREAELMDPQQRILLEVAWEALEHAGIPPMSLGGGDAGVFVGVGSDDYGRRLLEDLPRIEAWTGIGASMCAVANRISYALDLRGPSFAVDTACSASLVAIHLACRALASGETPLALVGGVNVMAGPGLTMVLDAAGAISPDGRCKSFDAAANGYGRGEGAGMIVLKRLSDADRDGDRVLAVIRGSAVNQDGHTNGIMAPSGEAQTHLLRQAYRVSGVDPATVDYVEAHGTGTRAGDPIEASAMAAVFGAGRPAEAPCLIGSVKSNIGHLEAGSGVAGVIKAVLALQNAELPPSLNFTEPNPAIPWSTAGLEVVTEPRRWPKRDHPRRAGVSGYGYGGTIAHIVLEQGPDPVPSFKPDSGSRLVFPISSATETGLADVATKLIDWLEHDGGNAPLASIHHTLTERRAHLTHRATVVAADYVELLTGLKAVAAGEKQVGVSSGRVIEGAGPVWVFSGHGSQWVGMGRDLLVKEPVFGGVLDEIGPIFAEEIGLVPREVLLDDDLTEVDVIQPMIFAVQVALAAVWRHRGVEPAAVIGHSVGEIAAAVVAGALELSEGARLICRRSVLLREVAGKGAMAMVNLPFAEVEARLVGRDDVVAAIAASPLSTVVAGDIDAVEALARRWESEELVVRRVASDVAFHSAHMEPLLPRLIAAVDDAVDPAIATIPVYTTALPDPRAEPLRDGSYWAANLRNPVRFTGAVQAAFEDGYRSFVEVSAHPVVAHSISETLEELDISEVYVGGSLRRNTADERTLLDNLGALHCAGSPVRFTGDSGDLVDLPTMAWQHKRFWRESGAGRPTLQHDVDSNTLLGGLTEVTGSSPLKLWQTYLDSSCSPYPGDHPVQGVEIIPAAVLLNTFATAAAQNGELATLADVTLRTPVAVAMPKEVQVSYQDSTLRLTSRALGEDADAEGAWLTHTTAGIDPTGSPVDKVLDIPALRSTCPVVLPNSFVIDRLAGIGVAAMGFPWQIDELRELDGQELLAFVDSGFEKPDTWGSVLDAALSIASVVFAGPPILRMPAGIRQVALDGESPSKVVIHVRVAEGRENDTVHVDIAAEDGKVVATMTGLRYGVLDGDPGASVSPSRLVHQLVWRELELDAPGGLDAVVVVGDAPELGDAALAAGITTYHVDDADSLDALCPELNGEIAILVVPVTGADVAAAAVDSAWLLTSVVQRVTSWSGGKVWAVTAGSPAASPMWGVGRVVAGEHPERWGGIVEVDGTRASAEKLIAVLRSGTHEDVIRITGGELTTSRLAPADNEIVRAPVQCRPDGTYLVTGGIGVLGLEVARWLAGRGARRLVLAGRRPFSPRAQWEHCTDPAVLAQIDAVRALEGLGVTVKIIALDVTDAAATAAALDPAALGLPAITGIVHAAGVLDNRMLVDVDEESLASVMAPKVRGAWVLNELFPVGSLDFFALFSSCGYLLGLPGQTSYGAANAFLDALAAQRPEDTISFGWTSWRGLGMSTSSAVIDLELNARGTADISLSEAFRSWEFAERRAGSYFAVLRMIAMDAGRPIPLLREITVEDDQTTDSASGVDWTGLDLEERQDRLAGEVRALVADEIKMPAQDLDLRKPLLEMGLDSVMTLVIRRRLEKLFRVPLPATLLWNRPTVTAIAGYLAEQLGIVAETLDEVADSELVVRV